MRKSRSVAFAAGLSLAPMLAGNVHAGLFLNQFPMAATNSAGDIVAVWQGAAPLKRELLSTLGGWLDGQADALTNKTIDCALNTCLRLPVSALNGGIGASTSTFWRGDGTWVAPSGAGTVTSVGLSMPGRFTVAASPITGAGTLAVTDNNQSANLFFAGPSSGSAAAPSFRALSVNDFNGGSGASSSTFWRGDGTWAAISPGSINLQAAKTGAYELVAGDAGSIIPVNSVAGVTITIDQAGNGYFPPNSQVTIVNSYLGTATANPNVTVSIHAGATSIFYGTPTYTGSGQNFFLSPQMTAVITSDASNNYFVQIYGLSPGIDYETGANVTLQSYDCSQTVQLDGSSTQTVTIPTAAGTTLPQGCVINMIRTGVAQAFFSQVGASGPLFSASNATHDGGRYTGFSITILRGGATGMLAGSLSP